MNIIKSIPGFEEHDVKIITRNSEKYGIIAEVKKPEETASLRIRLLENGKYIHDS